MKHNTHIYIAKKSIEFMYDALGNIQDLSGKKITSKTQREIIQNGKTLQRLLNYHEEKISEASWAPDDILCDKALYHTFKLFTKTNSRIVLNMLKKRI